MRVLIFQHATTEAPGTLTDWLRSRGHAFDVQHWYKDKAPRSPAGYDWLVVLGGAMNVDSETENPWLVPEKAWLRAWLSTKKPVLGICLGGQMLSQALGGKVTVNAEREIGFQEVHRNGAEHPALKRWPQSTFVYQYHEDTFSIPPGARALLASPACPRQAFAADNRTLALQFHPESTSAWITLNGPSIEKKAGEKWVQTPLETAQAEARHLGVMTENFFHLLDDFVEGWALPK